MFGYSDVVEILLKSGANINEKDVRFFMKMFSECCGLSFLSFPLLSHPLLHFSFYVFPSLSEEKILRERGRKRERGRFASSLKMDLKEFTFFDDSLPFFMFF